MTELLTFRVGRTKTTHLNLWCTPCGEVHDLAPGDVERIVYALAAAVPVIYEDGFEDGGDEFGEGRRDHVPDAVCLQVVLAEANTGQQYLGQVTEAVANREQAGPTSQRTEAGS